jgi:hypothetical protein
MVAQLKDPTLREGATQVTPGEGQRPGPGRVALPEGRRPGPASTDGRTAPADNLNKPALVRQNISYPAVRRSSECAGQVTKYHPILCVW